MNQAAAEMDFVSGLRNFTPKMQVPDLPKAPMTLNNINVNQSVVGPINTGQVQTIDVSITVLDQAGNKKVGDVLNERPEPRFWHAEPGSAEALCRTWQP